MGLSYSIPLIFTFEDYCARAVISCFDFPSSSLRLCQLYVLWIANKGAIFYSDSERILF